MDKNTLLGLLMMGLIIFGFMYCGRPKPQDQQQQATQQQTAQQTAEAESKPDTLAAGSARLLALAVTETGLAAEKPGSFALSGDNYSITADTAGFVTGTIELPDTAVSVEAVLANATQGLTPENRVRAVETVSSIIDQADKYRSFGRFLHGEEETVSLDNGYVKVDFSTRGAMMESATLLDPKYVTHVGDTTRQVTLFRPDNASYGFELLTEDQRIDTREMNFTIESRTDSTVVMSLPLSDKSKWSVKYTLLPGQYLVKMEVIQQGMNAMLPASTATIKMNWHEKMARNELGRTFEEQRSGIFYQFLGETPEDLNAHDNDLKDINGRIKWVAFKNQFFSSVLISDQCFSSAKLVSNVIKDDTYLKDLSMEAQLPYNLNDGTALSFHFYLGPNDYPILSSIDDTLDTEEDLDLTRLIPLGWGIFRWINTYLIIPVFTFLGSFISSYGIIILLLTIFIKIILFPFTYKSYKSQAKMRLLAPEIKQINDKYPDKADALKKQQETMNLYRRAGASPFSGCLPMLLQMPVLIAMFSFFPSAIELRGQSFLWASDLSAPDVILTLPFSIPFYGNHVSLFCLLMTVVNIVYTRISIQNQPGNSSMPGMKWMMYLMPVMFLFFFNDYASGLSYYYFLSLLITILQTWITRKVIDEKKMRAQMLANASKPRKKSKWQARLEEAQRKQQAAIRAQQNGKNRRR